MIFIITVSLVLAADVLTKNYISSTMNLNETTAVIPGIFDLTYIHNYGAAFSIFQGKRVFLILFTALVLVGMSVYVAREYRTLPKIEIVALALICGGGIGNLICRVSRGYVVDFLNIYIIPIFNVADMAVTVGAGLLILMLLLTRGQDGRTGI